MENKLTIQEFDTILNNSSDVIYQKLNKEIFNKCINSFNEVRLSDAEKDCIKKEAVLFHSVLDNVNSYFKRKLIK